jgi:hypothetical protein
MGSLSKAVPVATFLAVVASVAGIWYRNVDSIVSKPYLVGEIANYYGHCDSNNTNWIVG